MRNFKIRRNTFGNTEIYEIRDFMHVRRPVNRMALREVGCVVAYKCFMDFMSTSSDEPGTSVSMFGIVIATHNESWTEGIVKAFKLFYRPYVY
jgi:hypothetical protein